MQAMDELEFMVSPIRIRDLKKIGEGTSSRAVLLAAGQGRQTLLVSS
jgi:hypothetical protein